jgi:signal transduction histidine kinase
MNPSYNNVNIVILIVLGTVCMAFIFAAVVIFVIKYQRKIIEKSREIALNNLRNQKLLLESTIVAKEEEMKRIARELHDGIGSEINALRMLIHNADIPIEIKNELNLNCKVINKNIRSITVELMPVMLEKIGLEAALETLFEGIQKFSGVKIMTSFKVENSFELSEVETLSLYRIVQELTNNIIKHNKANELTFSFYHTDSELKISLTDDGNYFSPEGLTYENRVGHGLFNIESRLQLIKGTIAYLENKPNGTIVIVVLQAKCSEESGLESQKIKRYLEEV